MTENMTEEDRAKFNEAMNMMLNMINPHLEDVMRLAKSLRDLNKTEAKLDLPKNIDDKLLNISIDLYAVIKEIEKHFSMNETLCKTIEEVIIRGGK